MIAPPRAAETLLSSLGAGAAYRDAVIGDLAEEFSSRVQRDGAVAARWWYYGEALRSAPHLVRNWTTRATRADATRISGAVITSLVGLWIIALIGMAMVVGVLRGLGVPLPVGRVVFSSPALMAVGFTLSASSTVFGGYFAAWMDDETPMLSALTFALVWCLVDTITLIVGQHMTWQIIVPLVPLVGVTLGGMLQTSRRRAPLL